MLEKLHISHSEQKHFNMINVGRKRPTSRIAVAYGKIQLTQQAYSTIKERKLPKGDVLALAEVAAILGAKKTPEIIPMCHTLPLDEVSTHFVFDEETLAIEVFCQAAAHAKTGVEMEALTGVNAALLTIWDLTKAIEPNLMIGDIKLLVKTGGKSGIWTNPNGIPSWLQEQLSITKTTNPFQAAIVVMSDRASQGIYEDESGKLLQQKIKHANGNVVTYRLIPDEASTIKSTLIDICETSNIDLILASGGTGPGPRDVTPEVLTSIADRELIGFGEMLRRESAYFTDTAWLSRMSAVMLGKTLIISFPGSPKAIHECWGIIEPFIGDALTKIKKQGFEVQHAI